ncbi:MAG: nitrous oxide-stimulated promoter family protein [Planctomycetota bacterium]
MGVLGNNYVQKCPFGEEKGPCSQCEVHCYKPSMRERIQSVMRYAGPRMLSKHPVLTLFHLMKRWKNKSMPTK